MEVRVLSGALGKPRIAGLFRALVAIAKRADCVLEMVPAMGDFVPRGAPLLRVRGSLPDNYREAVGLSVIVERERSHESEPAFGIRKLVDIAERSIYSSPFQDPTTSVQAINAIHDVLRRLAVREFPSGGAVTQTATRV